MAGRKEKKTRAEINGNICIDFLVGIHLYLEKNIHERRRRETERGGERERCKEKGRR